MLIALPFSNHRPLLRIEIPSVMPSKHIIVPAAVNDVRQAQHFFSAVFRKRGNDKVTISDPSAIETSGGINEEIIT